MGGGPRWLWVSVGRDLVFGVCFVLFGGWPTKYGGLESASVCGGGTDVSRAIDNIVCPATFKGSK
jgi:hypothetical protein